MASASHSRTQSHKRPIHNPTLRKPNRRITLQSAEDPSRKVAPGEGTSFCGRRDSILLKSLGGHHIRPLDLRSSGGLPVLVSECSLSSGSSSHYSKVIFRMSDDRSGDSATDQKGAIEEVTPHERQFVNQMFLVPKKNGTYRPVFNLKSLSVDLCKEHFKMEGLSTLK